MNRHTLKWISRIHRWTYIKSDGRFGRKLRGLPMILLTTTGRKSGVQRTTPLLCMPDEPDMIVVASNGGSEKPPAWWFNLEAKAEAHVQYGRRKWTARAHTANAEERAELWPRLVDLYPDYANYQAGVERKIPVVVLSPLD